ncbi:Linoleate 13S-lipoxygenase 2-1, chloroplastic [Morella rubra]|uniref:Lipoxygenase n=1 Tax=Morella rubra TaxID=262757 RepID=A0A6A1WSY1_9ROSI|nr:Linoleate 13S-lipoxygenase 2-1, chloroplastic [Morella rubra]
MVKRKQPAGSSSNLLKCLVSLNPVLLMLLVLWMLVLPSFFIPLFTIAKLLLNVRFSLLSFLLRLCLLIFLLVIGILFFRISLILFLLLLVREFYSNFFDVDEASLSFSVFIRGQRLRVSPDVIASLFGVVRVPEPVYPYVESSREPPSFEAMSLLLFGRPYPYAGGTLYTSDFSAENHVVSRIALTNLYPVSHLSSISLTRSYLPSQTPSGLKRLRDEELVILRGNGEGERESFERVYDYDVYNDLGNPDSNPELKRPVLGGKEHPYPRRGRTGRPRCESDPLSESRSGTVYVPRDESFSEVKKLTFSAKIVYSVLHAFLPSLETAIIDSDLGFPYFNAIDSLFNEGVTLPPLKEKKLRDILPRLLKGINDREQDVLRFETPETMDRDSFFWSRDEEFARQTLAGLNPYSIKLVTEWPLKSKLDPKIYGPSESAITTEIIEEEIKGFMTVEEAINQKKLFIIDYHDLFLPYVSKVREIKGTTFYGSRTMFFLSPDGTLRPLAIELTRPQLDGKPQWKEVFTPSWDATGVWLWRLAKAHVLAHESGYHQLVSHWLRTHAATEPYLIATNRQLSAIHPIYRLLHPHFRYTMEINAFAREVLINGGGIIENSFSPAKYSMEFSSVAYDQQWQFNLQALPADLISRGLAVEDSTAPHGLKLTIEDYPFANDGLILWDSMKEWVSDYVNHHYPEPSLIESDRELQQWWTEIRTVGHGDKKDEPWWPILKTPKDLIEIITTIVWVSSAHHAAVNFGQYAYAGYFPNRPTIARTNMPNEDPSEESWSNFLRRPEDELLRCFPSQIQATRMMAVMDILSNHSPDEEYLGEKIEPTWAEDPFIKAAFERFNGRLVEFERIIDERNANRNLKNRNGAGVLPYELLKPFSPPGVTGKGVPYSISI